MAAGDLTTVDAVKRVLGLTTDGSDLRLQDIVTAISAFVPGVISRGILTQTYVEVRQGNGKDRFQLRNWPVQSVSSVEWAGTKLINSVDLMSSAAGIATDGRSLILVGNVMPYRATVRVTYVAGWDIVPADIADAVAELSAEEYTRATHIGETSHSSGGQTTVSFDRKAMHDAIAAKLNNYMAVAPLC